MTYRISRPGDALAGLVLAALGSYVALQSLSWQVLGPAGPGPGFFPLIYGTLMLVLALALLSRSVLRRSGGAGEQAERGDARAAILIWLLLVAAIAAMKYVGFLVAFGLLLLLVSRFVFSRPLWQGAMAAVVGPVLFYVTFVLGLQVRLPVGSVAGF